MRYWGSLNDTRLDNNNSNQDQNITGDIEIQKRRISNSQNYISTIPSLALNFSICVYHFILTLSRSTCACSMLEKINLSTYPYWYI